MTKTIIANASFEEMGTKDHANVKHGFCRRRRVHPLYYVWRGMLGRCHYKRWINYSNYGGRGIIVCDEWKKFENFARDMLPTWRPGLWIERKDCDGNYSKSNCVWKTPLEQCDNKRNTIKLTHNDKTMSISQWANVIGIPRRVLALRVWRGWTTEEALTVNLECANNNQVRDEFRKTNGRTV